MFHKVVICFLVGSTVLLNGCVIQPVNAPARGPAPSQDAPVAMSEEVAAAAIDAGAYKLNPLDPIYIRFSGIMDQQQLELHLLQLSPPDQTSDKFLPAQGYF